MAKLLMAATPISYYLVVINVVAFILYGLDKAKAVKHQWRIPEATLLGAAFAGGAFGAFAGMIVFHHKTRKMKFRILIPIAILIWLTLGGFLAERDVVGLTKAIVQRMNIMLRRLYSIIAALIKITMVQMIRWIF